MNNRLSINPKGRRVLLEPFFEEETAGGIILPVHSKRMSDTGFVRAVGPKCSEDLKEGDFVLLEEHGFESPGALLDTFFVVLRHDTGAETRIRADQDTEPVVRGHWLAYQANPSTAEVRLTLKDEDSKDEISFLTSEIVDLQSGLEGQSGFNLQQKNHISVPFEWAGEKLIFIDETEIMAIITASKKEENVL